MMAGKPKPRKAEKSKAKGKPAASSKKTGKQAK
jgi:hypothetical protein